MLILTTPVYLLVALTAFVQQSSTATVNLPADFLNLLLLQRGQQPSDPCYDEFDKPRYCRPDFVNAALGRGITASSECGANLRGPETFCRLSSKSSNSFDFLSDKVTLDDEHLSPSSSINRTCYLCDRRNPKTSHPASLITDVNDPRNTTCWVSSLLPYSNGAGNHSAANSNVTLTLSLGKRFEITYVSITFCQEEPTAFSIWKSDDFGATWEPFRKYAQDCRKSYNAVPGETIKVSTTTTISSTTANSRRARRKRRRMVELYGISSNDDDDVDPEFTSPTPGLAPTCIEQYGSTSGAVLAPRPGISLSESRVVFPTLELAPPSVSLDDLDTSKELQQWVSATDIRIEFSQLPAHYSAASIAETRYFSVSDLAVGGRCKCNGHASRCIPAPGEPQRLQCDCRHNTEGEDCGQCKPFFVDRPWLRATANEPNECVACNCNLHARQCRFNKELWKLSGQRSGGVCIGCRHNTAGRNCQYCREGFFRDHTKPITHRRACKVCECHPVGSLGKTCNQTSGQCPCKEGVEGISCSRCAPGFQQTNSPIQPCVRQVQVEPAVLKVSGYQADDPYTDSVRDSNPYYAPKHHQQRAYETYEPESSADRPCESLCRRGGKRSTAPPRPRLSFSKWCKAEFAAVIELENGARLRVGSWTRLTARVFKVYSRNQHDEYDDEDDYDDNDDYTDDDDDNPLAEPTGDEISVWIQTRALQCKCIRLRPGRKWFVTGRLGRMMAPAPSAGGRAGRSATPVAQFIIDPKISAVVRWRSGLVTRLKKYVRMERAGACANRRRTTTTTTAAPIDEMDQDDYDDETVVDAYNAYVQSPPNIDYNGNGISNHLSVVPSVSRRSPPISDHRYVTNNRHYPAYRHHRHYSKSQGRRFSDGYRVRNNYLHNTRRDHRHYSDSLYT